MVQFMEHSIMFEIILCLSQNMAFNLLHYTIIYLWKTHFFDGWSIWFWISWISTNGLEILDKISSIAKNIQKEIVINMRVVNVITFSQTTNFRLIQVGCRQQFEIWWKWKKVLKMDRKHFGKRRNCSLWAISPSPMVFSKDLYCKHVKTRACLGKG